MHITYTPKVTAIHSRTVMHRRRGALLLAAVFLTLSVAREEVSFDYGWRFSKERVSCNASAFPRYLNGVQCSGLKKVMAGAGSADDCRDECCNDMNCLIWQFAEDTRECWTGQSSNCSRHNAAWVGGAREPNKHRIPPQALRTFDDSKWELVDVPHDGLINGTYDKSEIEGHAYLPMHTLYYRKHFHLPKDWRSHSIWLEFDGVFRASNIYLNGVFLQHHDSGYTSFSVRLDNFSLINYGEGTDVVNVIVVQANPGSSYSGWWYEGGGIYRHTRLVAANYVHIPKDSVYSPSVLYPVVDHDPKDPRKGQYSMTILHPTVDIVNEGLKQVDIIVTFQVFDVNGKEVTSAVFNIDTVNASGTVTYKWPISAPNPVEIWSINRPYLYQFKVQVLLASNRSVLDSVTQLFGISYGHWDPNAGFSLNGKRFIWRGFNNHNDFAGVGVAIPDRIHLFRGQMMRAVGGNAWRMSHNPPSPVLLDILDNIGIIVWDENREFGDSDVWLQNQKDMVKRDRSHPSVKAWSFCNEGGCSQGDVGGVAQKFSDVTKLLDSYRPVTANMNGGFGNSSLTKVIDVQGFSHQLGTTYDKFHKQFPDKPLIGSECCTCRNQRGEDFADPSKPAFSSFNGDCNQIHTGYELNRDYVAGCMVWTLFDYYGEPTPYGWPMVSSSSGSIDLAGFAKPSAYWYRAWWYYSAKSNKTSSGFDVPLEVPSLVDPLSCSSKENSDKGYMIDIVQNWEPVKGKGLRTIQAYTNAKAAALSVNGKAFGNVSVNWQGWAEWKNVPYSPGSITATALDSHNRVVASDFIQTAGKPVSVLAMVDVPSVKTGTGSSLVLNGQDTGMISAAIIDGNGAVVPSASHNVTFRIIRGPGRIIGVGNGDPSCHEPNQVPWRSAHHGLARAIVKVTQDSSSSTLHRKRLLQIDKDGGVLTRIVGPGDRSVPPEAIVVEASVAGLGTGTVSIPVSNDEDTHGVLAVARTTHNFQRKS